MLVLDSSVILAWVLDDEDHLGPDLLRRLTTTEVAKVPCHWILEVANGLQMAVKRRRLAADDPPKLLARIGKPAHSGRCGDTDPRMERDTGPCRAIRSDHLRCRVPGTRHAPRRAAWRRWIRISRARRAPPGSCCSVRDRRRLHSGSRSPRPIAKYRMPCCAISDGS